MKDPFLQGKLPNRTIKYAQKRSRPANIILATVNQAMLRESSKKVIWRSVVVVGAAVVDSGIMTETVAVSARKGDMNVKYFAGGCENISSLFFFYFGVEVFFFAYFLYKRFSGQENNLLTFFFFRKFIFYIQKLILTITLRGE